MRASSLCVLFLIFANISGITTAQKKDNPFTLKKREETLPEGCIRLESTGKVVCFKPEPLTTSGGGCGSSSACTGGNNREDDPENDPEVRDTPAQVLTVNPGALNIPSKVQSTTRVDRGE